MNVTGSIRHGNFTYDVKVSGKYDEKTLQAILDLFQENGVLHAELPNLSGKTITTSSTDALTQRVNKFVLPILLGPSTTISVTKRPSKVVKIAGDGNCLFASIATGLKINSKELREETVAWMRAHIESDKKLQDEVKKSSEESKVKSDDYLDYISQDKTFGSGAELYAISQLKDVNIRVNQGEFTFDFDKSPESPWIDILYNGRDHYDLLQ